MTCRCGNKVSDLAALECERAGICPPKCGECVLLTRQFEAERRAMQKPPRYKGVKGRRRGLKRLVKMLDAKVRAAA